MRFGAYFLLFFVILAAKTRADSPEDLQKKRIAFLRELEHKGLVLSATCEQFSNFILAHNSLPVLGRDDSVNGSRLDVDRSAEAKHPPSFMDGIHFNKPDVAIQIKAGPQKGNWMMTLDRTIGISEPDKSTGTVLKNADKLTGRTTFLFGLSNQDNKTICDLQTIDFSLKTDKSDYKVQKIFHAEDCIDLLSDKAVADIQSPQTIAQIGQVVLRQDCMSGIHYFSAVKQMLTADERKKRWGGK